MTGLILLRRMTKTGRGTPFEKPKSTLTAFKAFSSTRLQRADIARSRGDLVFGVLSLSDAVAAASFCFQSSTPFSWKTFWCCCKSRTSGSSSSSTARTRPAPLTPRTFSAPSSNSAPSWFVRWPQVGASPRPAFLHVDPRRFILQHVSFRQQVVLRPVHV